MAYFTAYYTLLLNSLLGKQDEIAGTNNKRNNFSLDFAKICGPIVIFVNTTLIKYFKNKLERIIKIILKIISLLAPIIVTTEVIYNRSLKARTLDVYWSKNYQK